MIEIFSSEESYNLSKRAYSKKESEEADEEPLNSQVNLKAKCSLVIPAYNEEKRIGPFLRSVKEYLADFHEIILILDGTDNTAEIARTIDPRFRIKEYDHRLGKGGAILEGFKMSSGEVMGYVDADGAISCAEVRKVFASVVNGNDVSIGSRWVKGAQVKTKQPLIRIILGRLYHYMAFAFLGLKTKDVQCGLKAFRAETVKIILHRVTLRNFSFDTAILYHCKKQGYNIEEVPISWKNVEGSKVRPFKAAFVMFISLLGLRIAHSRNSEKLENIVESVRDVFERA